MRHVSGLIALLIFTPAIALVVGGWTVWKENRAVRRRKRAARVRREEAESHADGLSPHGQGDRR